MAFVLGATAIAGIDDVVPVHFVNASKEPRRLYWVDFSGTRQPYGVLQPGQRAPLQTYVTHAWMVTDASDRCMGTTVVAKDSASLEIR